MAEPVLTVRGEPDLTLGWEVLQWCSTYIRQPDGPNAGEQWRFTAEQVRFVLFWYAVDGRGRFLYRRGVLRRMKGWGKSPLVSALALAELCGPVRFAELDRNVAGGVRARPVPAAWVQLAGVSEKQTTNTMSMVLGMCAEGPIVDKYGLDIGKTRIFTADGGRLEPITASAPTAEGARPTFVVEDETHWWTDTNGGTQLDRVNRRNLGKSRDGAARLLETTNAFAPGENSVAEKSFEAWQSQRDGKGRASTILYDCREAPSDVDLGDEHALMGALLAARGDSVWLDLERIKDEVYDPSTPPEESRRFYLNQLAAATDSWLAQYELAAVIDSTKVVADGEQITLGFDGSRKRSKGVTDATALVGCRVSDSHVFEIRVWEQPSGPAGEHWQVPEIEVDAAVAHAFDTWNVVGFYADPAKWETYVDTWEAKYGSQLKVKATQHHPCQWWMTGGRSILIVRALEDFHDAILDEGLTVDGADALVRHLLNARRRATPSGIQIHKEHPDSIRKIDAAVAAVLARRARQDALAAGVMHETKRTGEFWRL